MSDQSNLRRDLNLPAEKNFTDRIEEKIAKAEHNLEVARVSLEHETLIVAQLKKNYDAFHDATGAIGVLAPLIQDEVNALERIWLDAEVLRTKLDESHVASTKEVSNAHLARQQLQKIGLYNRTK